MIAIEGRGLTFSYGSQPLFTDIDIYVNEGECVALTGPSGCGKSTLCYILSGIIPRSIEGNVKGNALLFSDEVNRLTLAETVQRIGLVFQNPDSQLFSPTVEDEIAFGPENLCLPREEIGRRISAALKEVGMESFRYHSPDTLSGGQKQLIALAAVLACQPKALIFDEALSQLDSDSTELIKAAILKQKQLGRAILYVEHDTDNLDIADRIYHLEHGKIKEVKFDR